MQDFDAVLYGLSGPVHLSATSKDDRDKIINVVAYHPEITHIELYTDDKLTGGVYCNTAETAENTKQPTLSSADGAS